MVDFPNMVYNPSPISIRVFRLFVGFVLITVIATNVWGAWELLSRHIPPVDLRVTSVFINSGNKLCKGALLVYQYSLESKNVGTYQITRTLIHWGAEEEGGSRIFTGRTSFLVVPALTPLLTQETWISDPGGSYALYNSGNFELLISASGAGQEVEPSVASTHFTVLDTCDNN
jgi:hypothetical protein